MSAWRETGEHSTSLWEPVSHRHIFTVGRPKLDPLDAPKRTTYLSAERPSAARLNLAAGTLPSFYLLPKRASENNSKTSRSFRPRLSPTTGRGVPIKLHQQASHRFQSNTLNRDMHTKPAANYTKGPASAQRPLGSERSPMSGSGYSTGSPTHTALDSTVITLQRETDTMVLTDIIYSNREKKNLFPPFFPKSNLSTQQFSDYTFWPET